MFDGSVIQRHREVLAGKLLDGAPHEDIQEDLMNFFQDMGLFLERNHLDEYLVWATFGFDIVRWWAVCKDYILEERRAQHDTTLFDDFEALAIRCRKMDIERKLPEPTSTDLKLFLEGERNLASSQTLRLSGHKTPR